MQYIVHFLSSYFQQEFVVTTSVQQYISADTGKLNYSTERIAEREIWIKPETLLFQKTITPFETNCFDHNSGYKAFSKTEGDIGFDLLAASFYLLSRYEEYLPHQKDIYGRYAYENSLAFKNSFLHLPLINIWLEDFRRLVHDMFPAIKLQSYSFDFLPTYDIDIAWSYQHKGVLRNAGGIMKSIINGQWSTLSERIKVLLRLKNDPYDTYEWLDALHQQYGLKPIYFFHVGQKRTLYDKNISTRRAALQQLIQRHSRRYAIGIHPSWHSSDMPEMLLKEKLILEQIIGQSVTASRQHYIRFNLPETFRLLIAAGITDEYSMGYGSINGFRASVSTPFYWYDLEKEQETALLLHPFCYMDANCFFELHYTPQQALEEAVQFYQSIKKANGTFISIWHNSFLGTDPLYRGWREVYAQFMAAIHDQLS